MSALEEALNTASQVAAAAHADAAGFALEGWLNSVETQATRNAEWLLSSDIPTGLLPAAVRAWSNEQRLFVARQVGVAARALVAAELGRP